MDNYSYKRVRQPSIKQKIKNEKEKIHHLLKKQMNIKS